MSEEYRKSFIIMLLAMGPCLFAQNSNQSTIEAPMFSVIMAILTIIVLFLGIIIQKRWKD